MPHGLNSHFAAWHTWTLIPKVIFFVMMTSGKLGQHWQKQQVLSEEKKPDDVMFLSVPVSRVDMTLTASRATLRDLGRAN